MTDAQKKTVIKRQGKTVLCQGCGKEISPNDDLKDVEYVKTKRGSEWFFHAGCRDGVWKKKICWDKKQESVGVKEENNVCKTDRCEKGT